MDRVYNGVMQHITQFKMVNKNQLHLAINANYYDVCGCRKRLIWQKKMFSKFYVHFFFVNKRLDSLHRMCGNLKS